jgi:indolepyruvate decarboxylase
MKQTIGEFLFRRLAEAGVRHAFGVPGDYNLVLMRQLMQAPAPQWIGTCNELNGAYAADGYARLNGLGALILTNGVGALSAINGVAGSHSEHVPVVVVCGTVPLKFARKGLMLHHTLADQSQGSGRDPFYRAYCEVTEAQGRLDHDNAVTEIDRMILTAWRRKRPVYLEVPSDLPYLEVEVPEEPLRLTWTASETERLASCAAAISERLRAAARPGLLLDSDTQRFGVEDAVARLAARWSMKAAVLGNAKSAFDETSPLFAGIYGGGGSAPATRAAVEGSDCLITVGFRRIESTTGMFSDALPADAVHLNGTWTDIGDADYLGVNLADLLAVLLEEEPAVAAGRGGGDAVEGAVGEADGTGSAGSGASSVPDAADATLTQTAYWQAMQGFLKSGDVIVVEDGTSLAGAGGLTLPKDSTLVSQALVWGSIGYTTGALLGTLLAEPERRHVLFTGDGSFQLTAQEVSTMLRHGLKPFIFLINNRGYTIERAILGMDDPYNDVADWSYADLPRVFHRSANIEACVVRTAGELQSVLDAPHEGIVFVEAIMEPDDSPVALIRSGHALADSDYGPRGPQHEPNAQIPLPGD